MDATQNSKFKGSYDVAKQILSVRGNTPTSKEINRLANDNEFYSSLQKGNYGKMIASEKTLDYLKSKGIVSECFSNGYGCCSNASNRGSRNRRRNGNGKSC